MVLAHPNAADRLAAWRDELAGDRVLVLGPDPDALGDLDPPADLATSLADVTARLRSRGAVDLFVVLVPSDGLPHGCASHAALATAVLRHLTKGGAFVLDRLAAGTDDGGVLASLVDLPGSRDDVAAVGVTPDLVVVSQRHQRYLVLREGDVPEVLASREPDLAVEEIAVLPEGTLRSRTTVHHHGHEPTVAPMHDEMHLPRLVTRHYRGAVAMSGRTLMWSGHSVLPDTFRWHLADKVTHPMLEHSEGHFVRMKPRRSPRRSLAGHFYQLESTYPSHFGHVLTEVVSRLWGWEEAKRREPGLRVLVHPRRGPDPTIESAVFAAYGIAADDVVTVEGAVEVESVFSATPMWHNAEPHYVHPGITDVWERLGAGLAPLESDVPTSERIFVSRSAATADNGRMCRNLREVERRFADRGYTVVYPEQHSLPDQARLFREARVVAGFGGSALFNVMHTRRLEALLVLNHSGYFARNEHLFAALKGGESHYFWSPPDVVPDHPLSAQALRSDWEFDFAGLGAELDRVLAEF